ncbi:MAG: hypothetical protein ACRCX5_06385, partial [Bacteroidales bacterium]
AAHITKKSIWLPVVVAVLIGFLNISPIYIIIISAIGGIIYSHYCLKDQLVKTPEKKEEEEEL